MSYVIYDTKYRSYWHIIIDTTVMYCAVLYYTVLYYTIHYSTLQHLTAHCNSQCYTTCFALVATVCNEETELPSEVSDEVFRQLGPFSVGEIRF